MFKEGGLQPPSFFYPDYIQSTVVTSYKKSEVIKKLLFFVFSDKKKPLKPLFSLLIVLLLFSCSKKENLEKKFHNPYYDLAKKYRDSGKPDSAFIQFNQAKEFGIQNRDSLSIASSLINMAILLTNAGDYFGGQETSLQANKYLNENNPKHHYYLGSNYNNLGIATYNLKDYNNSLKLYGSAIKFSDDSLDTRMYLNNEAKVYQEIKDYKSALNIYDQILAKTAKNEKEYARVLTNIAKTKWLQNPAYNPVPDFLKSLQIRKKENDLWGQNSSYAHLSDYYTLKQPDSALLYAHSMYNVAQNLKSATDQLEALQKLIKLSPPKETKHFFNVYETLNDSVQNARSAAKNQFALIRYETEKSKADFLKAQAENAEKQNDILRKNIGIGTLILLLIVGFILYRRRQKELKKEKELEVKKTELKYVKKVHDGVANKIYQVMSEVENDPEMSKTILADKLEVIYKISRDLSYENGDFGNS
ncbi:ATP-binding protein, partial [Pedobacter sp. KBW01]|uniref:tetratricopeptide repeat protein n=1 Tax=Pedobacter sp. KBW01 TaxID=2153364 RepID=UPI000F90EEFC